VKILMIQAREVSYADRENWAIVVWMRE